MRTITKTIFTFDELSNNAKQKVLNDNRYTFVEHDNWWDGIYEIWIEKLAEYGMNITANNIHFSGFSSQGDGASFTCDSFDMDKLSRYIDSITTTHSIEYGKYIRWIEQCGMSCGLSFDRTDRMYYHHNTVNMYYASPCKYKGKAYDIVEDFFTLVDNLRISICKDMYNDLQNEYNYYTSDERIIEYLNDSGNEYYEDGTLYIDR
jgi:hypothetical protein